MSSHWQNESYSEMNRQAKIEEEQVSNYKLKCCFCKGLFKESELTNGACDVCLEIEEKHKND